MEIINDRVQIKPELITISDESELVAKLSFKEFQQLINSPGFSVYSYNRTVSEEHVNDIYKNIVSRYKKKLIPNFYNSFKFCNIKGQNELYLIDGQHRYHALKKFIEEHNPKFESEPHFNVNVYIVEDEFEIEKIFTIINNTLPITQDDINNSKLIEIIHALRKKYPEYIKTTKTKRPRIKEDDLFREMKNKGMISVIPKGNHVENVLSHIYNINKELGKKDYTYFGKDKNMNVMFASAQNLDFYLGLDESYNWINDLVQILYNEKNEISDSNKYRLSEVLIKYLKLDSSVLNGVDKIKFKSIQQSFVKKLNKRKDKIEKICQKFNVIYDESDTVENIASKIWKANTNKN